MKIMADVSDLKKGMKDAASEVGGLKDKIGKASDGIVGGFKSIAKGAAVVTGAVALVGGGMLKSANAAGDYGDRIDKMSQKLGMSTDGFQKWDYVLSQNGASIDSLGPGIKKLNTGIDGLAKGGKAQVETFAAIGLSYDDLKGKSPEQSFEIVARALQKVEDPQQKMILANQLLGKSGAELMPLLNGTGEELDALVGHYDELGIAMSEDQVKAAAAFNDTMDDLKRTFGAVGAEIGMAVMPIVQKFAEYILENMPRIREIAKDVFDKIKEAVSGLVEAIKNNMPLIKDVTKAAFDGIKIVWDTVLKPVLEAMVKIVQKVVDNWDKIKGPLKVVAVLLGTVGAAILAANVVIGVMTAITTAWGVATAVATGIGTAFAAVIAFITSPIGLVIVAITALIAIGVLLYKNWDKVKEVAGKVWEGVKKTFTAMKEGISTIFDNIKTAVSEKFEAAKKAVIDIAEKIKTGIQEKFDAMKTKISEIFEAIKKVVSTIFEAIKKLMTTIIEAAKDAVIKYLEALKTMWSTIFDAIKLVVTTIFNAIKDTMTKVIDAAKTLVLGTVDKIKSGFREKFEAAKEAVLGIFDKIKTGITDKIDAAKNAVFNAIEKIKSFFKFEWSLPKLKMPSFDISGKFSLNPPSVPKFGINWNARGAIFKKPTVLANGQGVGDASNGRGSAPEVVAPLSDLKQMLGLDDGNKGNTIINLNGSYGFRDKEDMDYFMNELALAGRRG